MKSKAAVRRMVLLGLFGLGFWGFGCSRPSLAAVANVSVVDFAFSPPRVTINVADQVKWTWTGGAPHSATSDGGLWDSSIHGNGSTFTQTFNTAGNFPYHCVVHPFMTASVTVQSLSNVPPGISIQPQGRTVAAGQNVTFSVTANGTPPLSYQWRFNNMSIPAAMNASLTLNNVQAANAGSYSVSVTNDFGTVLSSAAVLTVSGATALLVVEVHGNGTVSPNYNGQMLMLGKTYTLTAKPSAGYIFVDWTGSTNRNTPALTFVMQTNLVFQANFVPSPFGQTTASYNGLFFDPNGIAPQNSGSFNLVLTPTGKFTGKLQLGNGRLSLNGQFDAAGNATNTLLRAMQNSLTVALALDLGSLEQITGSVSDGIHSASLAGDRAAFDGRLNIAPQAGQYTMILPGSNGSSTLPGGDSYATVTVDAAGRIKLTGSLADGTKLTQGVAVSKNGDWPLFVSLYGGQGSVLGWLRLLTTPTNDVSGDLVWIKPSAATAKFYPAGFNFATTALGFRYHPPAAGGPVLNFTNGSVVLSGGGLPQTITNLITVGPNNHVANLSSNRLTLTFKSASGLFSGRVVNPATAQSLSFNGVALQGPEFGLGYFLGTAQSGQVVLGPLP